MVLIRECVCLVCIYMHGKGKRRIDPDDHIGKDEGTFIAGRNDKDNIIIFDMCAYCIYRSHMDMSFCDNHSFFKLYFAAGSDEEAAWRIIQVSRLAYDAGNA